MEQDFQYDVFLSHSAKDKAVVRPLAERLRLDRLNLCLPVIHPSTFIIQPLSNGSLAQFLYINWRPQDCAQEYAKTPEADWRWKCAVGSSK